MTVYVPYELTEYKRTYKKVGGKLLVLKPAEDFSAQKKTLKELNIPMNVPLCALKSRLTNMWIPATPEEVEKYNKYRARELAYIESRQKQKRKLQAMNLVRELKSARALLKKFDGGGFKKLQEEFPNVVK